MSAYHPQPSRLNDTAALRSTPPPYPSLERGMAVHALTRDGHLIEGVVQEVRGRGADILFHTRLREHVKERFFPIERLARPHERIAVVMEGEPAGKDEDGKKFRIDRHMYPKEHMPASEWPFQSYCVELQPGMLLEGAQKSPGVLWFLNRLPEKKETRKKLPSHKIGFDLPENDGKIDYFGFGVPGARPSRATFSRRAGFA